MVRIVENKEQFYLSIVACGVFGIDDNLLQGADKEYILKRNTVAIIFPYIRSQITLLTAQPGMNAIVLPPININALLDDLDKKDIKEREESNRGD